MPETLPPTEIPAHAEGIGQTHCERVNRAITERKKASKTNISTTTTNNHKPQTERKREYRNGQQVRHHL